MVEEQSNIHILTRATFTGTQVGVERDKKVKAGERKACFLYSSQGKTGTVFCYALS